MSEDLLPALVEDPTRVFSRDIKDSNFFKELVKSFVDPITNYSKLDEIYIEGLDASQVFGQTKLVAENACQAVLEQLDEFQESSEEISEDESEESSLEQDEEEHNEEEEVVDEENPQPEGERDLLEDEEVNDNDESDNEPDTELIPVKKDAFGLNDEFFDIDAFNKQILAMEETNDNEDDDEEVDYFAEVSDNDEIDYFDDFYDRPNQKKSAPLPDDEQEQLKQEESEEDDGFDMESLDDDEYNAAISQAREDLYQEKSTFEKHQEKLQKEIGELEDELVAEKKWTMKGEVKSTQRPEDSILRNEEDFDFDRVAKPVPIITEEITETIEDLIRKRIKDDDFNDLPKKFLNQVVKPQRQRVEVSETKSSKSLAEIYEDKFKGIEDNEKEEKLTKEHEEIQELFNKVNYKLDSLTSFNFVPKPHENKVIGVTMTTVDMEDAQPEFVSNEARLAPQEVFQKDGKNSEEIALKSGLSYSREELSREEKQRLRRATKRKKSKQYKDSQAKKSKTDSVVDTLSSNKNLTIINKSGQKTDVKGNLKKQTTVSTNNLKL
ncbi:U3 snoRNP protein [Yamadazyma tenuis]|uniref:U3 snoRNP protein n=1 Tax=Candida tenuis TaxID=2315449 RepID=UPI0027982506|nr:U3 snoRNP protein [Yamadazyma tenuis]